VTRRRRLAVAALVAAAALAAATQVHVTLPRTLLLVGPDGKPLAEAWVGYHFRGHRFATVQSNTWDRPGELARTEDGEMALPLRVHLRSWPLATGPEPVIDLVYVPRLHNATGPLGDDGRAGRVTVNGDRLVVADLGNDPEAWLASLQMLYGFVAYEVLAEGDGPWSHVRPGTVTDLANALAAESLAFRRQWGSVARGPAHAPPHLEAGSAERTAWEMGSAAELAGAPLWGDRLGARWHEDLLYLRARVADREATVAEPPP
jgi:hypothetical protein